MALAHLSAMPSPTAEVVFHEGELAVVTHTKPSSYRMREVRRVAVTLSADDADALAGELRAYAERARGCGAPDAR